MLVQRRKSKRLRPAKPSRKAKDGGVVGGQVESAEATIGDPNALGADDNDDDDLEDVCGRFRYACRIDPYAATQCA